MKKTIGFLLFCLQLSNYAQQLAPVTFLDNIVEETSGLIFFNNTLVSHNDSGGASSLYELNTVSGNIARTVNISNATNVDWEDITYDLEYIYIGDFGNNNGSRTNLKIYKISIDDYLDNSLSSVVAEVINFSYSDQTDFTPSNRNTNYDAESLISYNGSLFVFTKNWIDNLTNIYAIPKSAGTYSVSRVDSINAQGLITGADYNSAINRIVLIGYDNNSPFLLQIENFSGNNFSGGLINRFQLTVPQGHSTQTEGIASLNNDSYYISAEKNSGNTQVLYSINVNELLNSTFVDDKSIFIYPNPTKDILEIDYNHSELSMVIYDVNGKVVIKQKVRENINISNLNKGVYFIKLSDGKQTSTYKIIKK